MQTILNRLRHLLAPAVLTLFLLQAATLPLAIGQTWAGRSESPSHTLTYTIGKLTWDKSTGIDANGAARLSLFKSAYPNVASSDGSLVVAPGTAGGTIVRLKNNVSGPISYRAVLYQIKADPDVGVEAALTGGEKDAQDYPLPKGVSQNQVIRAVQGKVKGKSFQDFDISWLWSYASSHGQDAIDTTVGIRAARGANTDVTVGLYIVVEDNNDYTCPQTRDDSHMELYVAAMCVSAVMLVWLLGRRKEMDECEE